MELEQIEIVTTNRDGQRPSSSVEKNNIRRAEPLEIARKEFGKKYNKKVVKDEKITSSSIDKPKNNNLWLIAGGIVVVSFGFGTIYFLKKKQINEPIKPANKKVEISDF